MSRRVVFGGAVAVLALVAGGLAIATRDDTPPGELAGCERSSDPALSVARQWDEQLLDAVRSDFPAPTVHARNLFHVSAAMWDAWAAFDPEASGVFVDEKATSDDVTAARETALSFAAYRILVERYLPSPGAEQSVTNLDGLMDALCYDRSFEDVDGDSPAALGNRIAATVLDGTLDDGSNEAELYAPPDYEPVNPPLVVAAAGAIMNDPDRWQPLQLENMVAQNGVPLDTNLQKFIGPHWGAVVPFAIDGATDDGRPPLDPGPPPRLADPASRERFQREALEVIRFSSRLDPAAEETIDIGPGSRGDTELGTYDGNGRELNPVTGEPYEPVVVRHGDFARVVAEFWADGPRSETPPGHWNTIANEVSDDLEELRIGGTGPAVDRLEWDVKLYLALNGAVHDAAIAAWGVKGYYDSARPISMIRYMGGLGQSSDPSGPSYHPDGLPLEEGLVEVVTTESSAPGARHEALAAHVGEVAVRAWRGTPEDRENDVGGVGWIRAVVWVPYQLPTFVTPSFAGYVSGHSTFSRAAAVVLTSITGNEYFPGGLGEWTVPAGSLEFEAGPSEDVVLQWATYADAADEAAISRLYGGIHVPADDLTGRVMGAECGSAAWAEAERHYSGDA